jgi:hypothetical protein
MNVVRVGLILVALTISAFGQLTARNPVDDLKNEVTQTLAQAGVPFTPDQERQLALLIEEQRQAAENLFGVTWDFSKGPPEGDQRDQALAGIRWMYEELRKRLPGYMTDPQRAAWESYDTRDRTAEAYIEELANRGAQTERIQQIRVTNNAFNVETGVANGNQGPQSGGARTEVIERGGVGAFHGNFSTTFQDESLNARNPFASNKPPYHERTINANISGPVIQNRLSLNFAVTDNKRENVGTVQAETPNGPFSLGVTRPVLNRSYDARGVFQLADAHSLHMRFQYATRDSRNENVGDFSLPERASRTETRNQLVDLREIFVLSERTVHDVHFTWRKDHSETNPFSNALAIIVKDAFTGGGSQNRNLTDGNEYELSNLIYFAGDKLMMRSGFQTWHRREHTLSEDDFFGEFTFSDLASYQAGKPLKYRIKCCDPSFSLSQTQLAFFSQNDIKLTPTFTLMLGMRYFVQTNIRDRNNVDPRIGFAYALGNATVIRGGIGVFTNAIDFEQIRTYSQLDGKRRYEIQIDRPGWPDPFSSGAIRPPSRHVIAPDLRNTYYFVTQVQLERSLPRNLFVTVAYDLSRGIKPTRIRDLNAPLPGTGIRPFPDEGQIIQLETGLSTHQHFKMAMRQRFSVFNVTAEYMYYHGVSDQAAEGNMRLPADSRDVRSEWGRTTNPPHTFNSSINLRLPMDVYLTTAIDARSGRFYTITTGKDDNGDGVSNDRPAGVPKSSEVGPRYFDVSFNVSKAIEFNGTAAQSGAAGTAPRLNVFANLNNAFNMTHLGVPSGVMTSPFFRRSYNATSPRQIEVGMRFQF